jgi:molybdate transport system substrate-binding protein
MAEAVEGFMRAVGEPVVATASGGVDVERRVASGEVLDLVVLAQGALVRLVRGQLVDAATVTGVVTSAIGLAVPTGQTAPPIQDEAEVRAAFEAAARIGYSTGPSGDHLLALLARWGWDETKRRRLVQAPPGVPVARLVADRQVDLGLQQLSELRGIQGMTLLGPLPAAIQQETVFVAAVCCSSTKPAQARRLLRWLADDALAGLKLAHGLQPVKAASRGP